MVKTFARMALLSCLLSGCEDATLARTQLMLVADTNVEAPGQIDFEIVGPDGHPEPKDAPFASAAELPRTLALVHTQGPLGPFTVKASIRLPDAEGGGTITRTHRVSFVRGKTLLVPLHLARACLGNGLCTAPEQCDETKACVDEVLDAALLDPYRGVPARVFAVDAGAVDAGNDASLSDSGLADAGNDTGDAGALCDGELVDLQTNKDHCGQCGYRCLAAPPGNQSRGEECRAGKCHLICDDGFLDCNDEPDNGCEVDQLTTDTSREHCGGCNIPCPKGGGKKCTGGVCK